MLLHSFDVQYLSWKEKKLNDKVSFASLVRYSRLMQVDLKESNLWFFPEFITHADVLICITEIDLSHNSVFYLKELMMHKFGQIRVLNLSFNLLFRIPPTISSMKSLHTLDISHNSLRSLPLSMRECILLTTISLGSNNFFEFPDVLLKMNLTELVIDNNLLKELPLDISALENLSILSCCSNRLTALPPTFPELRNMTRLDTRDNLITGFSLEILRMPKIEAFTFWGNPCQYVQNIESGNLNDLPDEWRVSLPQLLAAGNPPPQKAETRQWFCDRFFSSKKASAISEAHEQSIHFAPPIAASDAMGFAPLHSDVNAAVATLG